MLGKGKAYITGVVKGRVLLCESKAEKTGVALGKRQRQGRRDQQYPEQ